MNISRRGFIGLTAGASVGAAQTPQDRSIFRVKVDVDMVVLSFTVTDSKSRYINGLKPTDFRIYEDGILQKISTFAEGAKAPLAVNDDGTTRPLSRAEKDLPGPDRPDAFVGTNVFVLFDTSNFMYRGFVYAEDAIADFVRGLDRADSIAVYTFSRNLSRAASLTRDHSDAITGLRKSVAGDDTALYNALLLTLRDAAKVAGRKVVIVFSNGPDNASMVAPADVSAVAEDEGIPIYVISTSEVNKDPISSNEFKKLSQRTGGKATGPKPGRSRWRRSEAIREDIGNSYTITYTRQRIRIRASARSASRLRTTSAKVSRQRPPRISPKPHLAIGDRSARILMRAASRELVSPPALFHGYRCRLAGRKHLC
jgi:VWFA-related protein